MSNQTIDPKKKANTPPPPKKGSGTNPTAPTGKKPRDPKKRITKTQQEQKRRERILRLVGICGVLLAILIVAGVMIYNAVVDHYLDKINVVTKETGLVFETEIITGEDGSSSVVDELPPNGELNDYNLPLICNNKYVSNYLLLAVDTRGNEAGRSDSMILVSVNTKTKKVVLCSFLRDILAAYPTEPKNPVAGKFDKLNHAHAYGGPELTMAVLKETFNIEVESYAKVNFSAFRQIVDAMGGLDMYLTRAEAGAINTILQQTMSEPANNSLHVTAADMLTVQGDGVYHLTGVQALSHARNRNVGSDWARTRRQRDLIEAMAKKATTLSLSQLNNLLNTVLPLITTNIQKDELKSLVGDAPSYLTYEIVSTRIPGDGMYTEQNYNIIPDLLKNCNALYELVYGEKAPDAPAGKNPLDPSKRYPSITTKAPTTTTKTPETVPSSSSVPSTTTKAPDTQPETKEPETKEPVTKEPVTKEPDHQTPDTQQPDQTDTPNN